MSAIANTAIIPINASDLYPEPGIDLVVDVEYGPDGEVTHAMEHIEWLPAPRDEYDPPVDGANFEWDWQAQLTDAGWNVAEVRRGTDEYFTASIWK